MEIYTDSEIQDDLRKALHKDDADMFIMLQTEIKQILLLIVEMNIISRKTRHEPTIKITTNLIDYATNAFAWLERKELEAKLRERVIGGDLTTELCRQLSKEKQELLSMLPNNSNSDTV